MSFPKLDFIYFDLDDTLLDHHHAQDQALHDCYRDFADHLGTCPIEKLQHVYAGHNRTLWQQYSAAEIGKDDVQRLRFERTLHDLQIAGLPWKTLGDHYMARYRHHWRWLDGAEAAYHAIADAYPVGIITNGFADTQRAKLAAMPGIAERAQAVVISEDVGHMKPHPAVFERAQALAGTTPDRILYVGDSLTSDVQGGTRAGWHVAWLTNDPAPAPDVFAFSEWPTLLDALRLE